MSFSMNWFTVSFSEIVRNYGLIIGGVLGILLAWRRTRASTRQADASLQQADASLKQADLARRAHVAELFNRAVAQLTHEKLEVRLGAIYTLRQIAHDFSDLAEPTFQLLATYLRESRIDYGDNEPPIEVQEIMNIMRDRRVNP
jgi:hypothetical protein